MTNKYKWMLEKDYLDLIIYFKKWHLNGQSGHGDLFARIIIRIFALTGMSNRELAKELGISKGLVSQAKSYLRNASPRLIEYAQNNFTGINTVYGLARIENYEEYERTIPGWIQSRFGLPHSRTEKDTVPTWIRDILICAIPHVRQITEGKYKGQFCRWGFIVPRLADIRRDTDMRQIIYHKLSALEIHNYRYSDKYLHKAKLAALHERIQCPGCYNLIFAYDDDDHDYLKCHKCGARKRTPKNFRDFIPDWGNEQRRRDGFQYLFGLQKCSDTPTEVEK